MKKLVYITLLAACVHYSTQVDAQDKRKKVEIERQNADDVELEIKNDKDIKLEIKNGEVYIDGKKVASVDEHKDQDGRIVQKKIIINGKELNDEEMEKFDMGDHFLFDFNENGKKPMLGVTTKASKDNDGAVVESVLPNSPAEKIGLQSGDVITRVNEKNISNPQQLVDAIGAFKPGNEVEITYERDNKFLTKNVVLKGKSDATTFKGTLPFGEDFFGQFGESGRPFMFGQNFNAGPKIGVSVEDRSEGKGVNVLDVTNGSAAQKAGIEKNDVITTFDLNEIENVDELLEAISKAKDKEKVNINVLRNGTQKQLSLSMPKNLKKRDL